MHAPYARVLVVDDDEEMRETVAAALETEGYRVSCAENGAQALALMRGYRPEAIVLDLSMPVMSGWELLDAVHERRDLREVPVLVLSAMRAPVGVAHLDKPVSLDELLATLDGICGSSAAASLYGGGHVARLARASKRAARAPLERRRRRPGRLRARPVAAPSPQGPRRSAGGPQARGHRVAGVHRGACEARSLGEERANPAGPVRRRQRSVRRRASPAERARRRPQAPVEDPQHRSRRAPRRSRSGPHGRAPREDAAARGLHARALSLVHPLQHRGRLDRDPQRRPVLGRLREDRGHGRLARVRDRRGRHRGATTALQRAGSRAARRRQRGDARHRHERRAAAPSGADVARLRRVVVSDDRARLGCDARALPGGPPAGGRPALRPLRRDAGEARRREGRRRRHARTRRGGAAPRSGRCSGGRRCSTSCSHSASRPRVLGGAMLVVVFEGDGRDAPPRRRGSSSPGRDGPARIVGGRSARGAMARAPLRRELPAGAGLRERSLRRHDGGGGFLVEGSARSTTRSGGRWASTCS